MSAKTPIETALDSVNWKESGLAPSDDGLPHATHEGVFECMGIRLRCYRLSDGTSVFHADDMRELFGDILG